MPTVRDLLKFKDDDRLLTIGPTETVLEAIRLMARHDVGSLIVMRQGIILGIVTERDYARKIVLEGRSSSSTQVQEIMRDRVRCVGPQVSVDDCRRLMTEDAIRYVPVVENDYLVGLVSIGDLVHHAISEKDFMIDELTRYITGAQAVKMRE